jgi:hypothetical protein
MKRLSQHQTHAEWFNSIASTTYETYGSKKEAALAESKAIKKERPLYNISHSELPKQTKEKERQQLQCNPLALLKILQVCTTTSISVVTVLVAKLSEQPDRANEIVISIATLCEASGLSKPTVIAAIDSLEDNFFIKRVCQSTYRIEPSLAWYGNQVDWAIALKEHRELKNESLVRITKGSNHE